MDGMVRIGRVTDRNTTTRQVRVLFPDSGMTSAWLPVLRHSEAWLPSINDTVLCLYLPVFNADGFVVGVI